MKTSQLTLLFVLITFFRILPSYTQGCSPGVFTTQSQIDSFTINYPGCHKIYSTLSVIPSPSNSINNLNGLSVIDTVWGNLRIEGTSALNDLTGLNNLKTVTNFIYILSTSNLTDITALSNLVSYQDNFGSITCPVISDNTSLTSLSGLEGLTTVGLISVSNNDVLVDLAGLNNIDTCKIGTLFIVSNDNLINLTGLERLKTTTWGAYIQNNNSLQNMNGLDSLNTLGYDFEISSNPLLASFDGLEQLKYINGNLVIAANSSLSDLSGLTNLDSINGSLEILANNSLTDLNGLEQLKFINGDLSITVNSSLSDLSGLTHLDSINGSLEIINNSSLTNLNGLENINHTTITNLDLSNSYQLSFCAIQNICEYLSIPTNPAYISSNNVGCESRAAVEHECITLGDENIIDSDISISVYPNPTTSFIYIDFQTNGNYKIMVNNLLGQNIYTHNCLDSKCSLDLGSICKNSTVIVTIYDYDNNQISTKRILVQ